MVTPVEATYPPALVSATDARHLVEDTLTRWGVDEATLDAARLLVSEAVSNAVRHAGTPCRLRIIEQSPLVRIEVRDGDPVPPQPQPIDPEALGGRGLQIIDAVARRWGVEPRSDGLTGKVVWFEVGD